MSSASAHSTRTINFFVLLGKTGTLNRSSVGITIDFALVATLMTVLFGNRMVSLNACYIARNLRKILLTSGTARMACCINFNAFIISALHLTLKSAFDFEYLLVDN